MVHGIFLILYLLQKVRTVCHGDEHRSHLVFHQEVPREVPVHLIPLQVLHTQTLFRSCSVEGKVRRFSPF